MRNSNSLFAALNNKPDGELISVSEILAIVERKVWNIGDKTNGDDRKIANSVYHKIYRDGIMNEVFLKACLSVLREEIDSGNESTGVAVALVVCDTRRGFIIYVLLKYLDLVLKKYGDINPPPQYE